MTTLIERPLKIALDYLYNLSYDELDSMIYTDEHVLLEEAEKGSRSVSKKNRKQVITNVKSYIELAVANEFEFPVKYSQRKNIYRQEGKFPSIQHIKGSIRSVLFKHNTFDIDQCNSHPKVLLYLMEKFCPEIPVLHLKEYCDNRKKYINELVETGLHPKLAKMLFLKQINKQERLSKKDKHSHFLDAFDREMKEIQISLGCLPEMSAFHMKGAPNALGKFMSNLLQHWEHKINSVMIEYLEKNNYEIAAYMHDGALVYEPDPNKSTYCNSDLLIAIEREVADAFPGLDMKWSYKPHNKDIVVPENYEEQGLEGGYDNCKIKWENQGYCKITQDVCFMRICKDGTTLKYTRTDIKSIGEDFGCYKFIDTWLEDSQKKTYETIGQYPPDVDAPPNVYNTWIPFAAESMEYDEDIAGMEKLLKHFRILCNDKETYNHFIKWLAYIIQCPSRKNGAIMPILIGTQEGGGKGTAIDIMRRMFGEKKVLETTSPSKHVFGNFNAQMEHAYLVYLNEMSKKEMLGVEEHLKSYITDKYIHINQKHIKTITIESNHKFICSTNHLTPKQSASESRRDWYIVIPNSLVGNKEYFIDIRKTLDCDNAIGTLYNYLKTYDFGDFASLPIPKGEYQKELERDSRKPILLWTEAWLIEMIASQEEFWGQEQDNTYLWEHYKKWSQAEFPTHTFMNRSTFSRNLSQLVFKQIYPKYKDEIPPVYKKGGGKTRYVFFKNKMCDFFKISYCMLDV